jgi:hypothetical protein
MEKLVQMQDGMSVGKTSHLSYDARVYFYYIQKKNSIFVIFLNVFIFFKMFKPFLKITLQK